MQISLTDISYSYEGSPGVALGGVTATFLRGWTGVVGSNGSGKTTLLRLVCGQLRPTGGSVTPRMAAVYCAQETELRPAMAEEFALDFCLDAQRIRLALGIEDEWVWRYETLSEGQRKRLQVAVALWQNPQLLALDEPTNHVDASTRRRILDVLAGFGGIGLLVSHDREMLDALVSQCLFVSARGCIMRPGTYSEGQEQAQLELMSAQRERKAAKHEVERLSLVKAAREHEAARADARRSKRHIDKGDKDAKARIDLAVFTGQDGKAGRRAAQLDARLCSAQQRLEAAYVEKTYAPNVWLNTQPSRRRLLVELEAGGVAFGSGERLAPAGGGGRGARGAAGGGGGCRAAAGGGGCRAAAQGVSCLEIPHLQLGPTDHIALSGANGTGKTSLVVALMQALAATDLCVLYVPQELSTQERGELLGQLNKLPEHQRGQVLSITAQLNSDPARILDGDTISPGEARKLMLALGILAAPQIIVMDEPTNHLDLPSTEALERTLSSCPCALLLVSHDSRFLSCVTSIHWHIEQREAGTTLMVL